MKLPERFKSRESDHVIYTFISPATGTKIKQDFFVNRGNALVGIIFAIYRGITFVLITKRSKTMFDSPSKLSLPCGYLNWDETRYQGMMREVYEETSFHVPDNEEWLIYNNDKQPIIVKDDPKELHQNITSIFLSVFNFDEEPTVFPNNVEDFKCREVDWVQWVGMKDFLTFADKYEWAFDHNNTIMKAWEHWNNLPYNIK